MNREFLFRGKQEDNGEWIEGYYAKIGTHIYILTGKIVLHNHSDDYGLPCAKAKTVAVVPETVGEYTGALDKNGKKIFEGDILKFINSDVPPSVSLYVVLWDNSLLAWRTQSAGNYSNGDYDGFDELCDCAEDMEVIGNIYDNPELLT